MQRHCVLDKLEFCFSGLGQDEPVRVLEVLAALGQLDLGLHAPGVLGRPRQAVVAFQAAQNADLHGAKILRWSERQ